MTSILELNDIGKAYLKDQLHKNYYKPVFDLEEFVRRANLNIAEDKLYIHLQPVETTVLNRHTVKFDVQHLKIKEKI